MSLFASLVFGSSLPLTASASTTYTYGSRSGSGTCTTDPVTVTANGGQPPYTYSWAYLSGDTTFTCNSPTSNVSSFTASITLNNEKTATWRCTITDTLSHAVTVDVTVDVSETSYGSDTR